MRQAIALLLASIVLMGLGSCGGGRLGGELNPSLSNNLQFQGEEDFVSYPLDSREISGFSIRQLDEPGKGYNLGVYTHMQLAVSKPAEDVCVFDLNFTDAPAVTTVYYELKWPANEYVLTDACAGDYFKHDDVMALKITEPGMAEVGHVRLNFDSKGGVTGTGSLARFVFI